MRHELKTLPEFFSRVWDGEKPFEIRKHDRDFQGGDTLILVESRGYNTTGREIDAEVKYILPHHLFPEGIPEGYCVMTISVFDRREAKREE